MSNPSQGAALGTLRPDLGTMYEFDLANNRAGFAGYRVLPIFDVELAADKFGRIPSEQLGKLHNVNRLASGGYNRVNFNFIDDSYATKEYGLEGVVDRRNANKYKHYIQAELATTSLVTHNVLAQAEKRVADKIFDSSATGWDSGNTALFTSVGTEWSTIATATPITNVMAASQKVRDNCGMYANAIVFSRKVFRNLVQCTQIIERIAASGAGDKVKPADITVQMLAQCFDLKYVIVGDASYDSTKEGQSTTFADIWDDEYAMVCRVAETQMIEEPCIGRTFHWTADGSEASGAVESYETADVRGDVIRVRHDVHEKIIYTECGHLLGNITA